MKVRRAVYAPMCPVDGEQTKWVNLTDPGDKTWSCPACGRFGWVLPVEYLERHPEENPVQVTGIRRQDVAAPAAQAPVAQTPTPRTDPEDGAGASATHPLPVAAMNAAAGSDVAEDFPADAASGPAAGLDGVALRDTPDTHGEPPGRTARRAKRRGRRRLRMLATGAGILTLGVGLAFASSAPQGDNRHAALPPVPSNTPDAMPSDSQAPPTTAAPASPTTPSGTSPDPTKATPTTAAPASPTTTPSGTSPDLPRAALAIKRPTIHTPPAPPTPLPTPSPARTLRMGDHGPDVGAALGEDRNGQ